MRYRFLTIVTLIAIYTGFSLSQVFPKCPGSGWLILLGMTFTIVLAQYAYLKALLPPDWLITRALVWGSSLIMGFWGTYVLLSIPVSVAYLLWLLLPVRASADYTYHLASAVIFAASIATTLAGLVQALRGPVVRRADVPVEGLPAGLDGLTIAQISDLHIGATIYHDYVARVVARVQPLSPHIIAMTGDIADGDPIKLRPHVEPLKELQAPLGKYFITGNHEYYSGALGWIDEAKRAGFIPLINENRVVVHGGEKVMVAGVADLSAHHFIPSHKSDPFRAVHTPEACALKVLLAHQPESAYEAERAGFDLQLSGHTHAGQFFPFSLLVKMVKKKFYGGLGRHGRMWFYVNAGTGYWGAANRFLIPSEITLLTIKRGENFKRRNPDKLDK